MDSLHSLQRWIVTAFVALGVLIVAVVVFVGALIGKCSAEDEWLTTISEPAQRCMFDCPTCREKEQEEDGE